MKPIETTYRGCRFRSRIEARWAVFFDTLGIKWWYEPEGFALRFDYEDFAAEWDMTEEELLDEGVPQTFRHLDGKEYWYLPDFYLPELNFWIEIKGPNPTKEEIEKAFILSHMAYNAGRATMDEAKTEAELSRAFEDFFQQGVYIIYGDIPWPFPEKGNIFGYGPHDSGSTFFDTIAEAESPLEEFLAGESQGKEPKYRSLLMGRLKLCWQECPLCLKIGVGKLGAPYCRSCHDEIANHIWTHLVAEYGIRSAPDYSLLSENIRDPRHPAFKNARQPLNFKAMKMTKDLMNPEFFASGHKSPRLQKAYSAARAARFEHGQSP